LKNQSANSDSNSNIKSQYRVGTQHIFRLSREKIARFAAFG